jgi:hypothetical protein
MVGRRRSRWPPSRAEGHVRWLAVVGCRRLGWKMLSAGPRRLQMQAPGFRRLKIGSRHVGMSKQKLARQAGRVSSHQNEMMRASSRVVQI